MMDYSDLLVLLSLSGTQQDGVCCMFWLQKANELDTKGL